MHNTTCNLRQQTRDKMTGRDIHKDYYYDEFLEHKQGLCPHPHDSHQSEVVDEDGHKHTASVHLNTLNTHSKHNEHAPDSYGQLNVVLGVVSLPKFSEKNTANF